MKPASYFFCVVEGFTTTIGYCRTVCPLYEKGSCSILKHSQSIDLSRDQLSNTQDHDSHTSLDCRIQTFKSLHEK